MHSNIHHTINATEQTARRDGHTLWYTHFRKLFALIFLMLASVGAWATDYVFKYGNNYLGVNATGTGIENLTTFDPARCIWTCEYNNAESTLDGTSRALRITYNGNTRYLTCNPSDGTNGASVAVATAAQNYWRINGQYLIYQNNGWAFSRYTYYRNGWRTSRNGRANDNSGYQTNNGNTDYRATVIASTNPGATDAITAPTISYSSRTATTITLNRTNLGGTYTPAATTIVVGGTTYYKGTGANGAYSTTAPSSTLNPTYTWRVTSGNASITQDGVVTPNNSITNNITVRLTTTNTNPALTKTTDYTISVSSTAAATTYTGGLNAVNPANATLYYTSNTGITLDSPVRKKNFTTAYQTYTASGNTFYRVNNNFQAEEPTPTSTDVAVNSFAWTLSGTGASYAQLASATGETNTLTYSTASLSDVSTTITVTANYAEGGNITKTATINLQRTERCTTPTISLLSNGKVSITAGSGETIYYKTDDTYNDNGTYAVYTGVLDVTDHTRIWAYSTRNGYLDSDPTNITVADPYNVVPSTYEGINLFLDENYDLTYTLNAPTTGEIIYDRVVYASSDPTVATVDQNGKITALSAGTTKVTLTGYKLDGTALTPVEVNVTVKNPLNDPSGMSVNSTNQTLNQGETWQIVATAYGTEPIYRKFKYEVTGTSGIVSVTDRGLVKALSQGNTVVTVTAYNYGDVLSNLTQTINITVVKPTSIDGKTCVYALDEITNANGSYILMDDISASNGLNITFTGTLDGNYHTISGLGSALFNSISGGTVKNVRLDNVTISRTGQNQDAGAIANTATNGAKIYNCGVLNGSVSGTRYVGGLVGAISGGTKVVNNYNYATVGGGQYAAGIVGYNGAAVDGYNFTNNCSSITGWTRTGNNQNFQLNTWSTENDPSGLKTPFIENWRSAGANLGNAQIRYTTLTGLAPGDYEVSLFVRMFNESNTNNPSGAYLYANGGTETTVNIANVGTKGTYNGHALIYGTITTNVTVGSAGNLIVGININNAQNMNWIAFKDLRVTRVASGKNEITNNMMYGDMTNGTNRSPVYGGNHTDNIQKANEYNYYRSKANLTYTAYNEQGAIDKDEFLTRFPFYRHIMNTHRELAAIKLFGSRTDANVNEIGHWVLNTEIAPYPIIEKWETNTKRTTVDIAANLPNTSEAYAGKLLTEMGSGGYLNVTVNIGTTSRTVRLPITDMDTLRYDFTWGKVVLPFANEFDGWTRNYSEVITGWKITSITDGTTGTLTNYNFADRDCTAKDLYRNSGYIFAQGGNYIVPYGVTAITIEANFATAYYLRDASYDVAYNATYGGATAVSGSITGEYHDRDVYTDLNTLLTAMGTATTPHTQAIVLVGNYHYNQNTIGGNLFGNYTNKGLTIMSCDEDNNQEPDYGWYSYHTTDRTDIAPVRFDFVPNIGIGMAARVKGSTPYPTIGIWHGHGWFELTETCVSFMSECEINSYSFNDNDNGNGNNRWIANSGYFIQIVRARDGNCNKLSYIQIGGNAYVEQLYPGPHMANNHTISLCPINVTGGEIKECFMTGKGSGTPNATGQNIYFWCAGGRIHKYLSAYMVKPSTNGVNVVAKVDHARIYRFFGGGTSPTARITGDIDVTMNNSLVDFYCGGPEFGDMASGKTVTTNATGTTFGQFYGAGFGGTSTTWVQRTDNNITFDQNVYTYPSAWTNYTNYYLKYNSDNGGWGSNYDFEYIMYSGGNGQGVGRFYTGYSDFSLAQTGSVTSNLTDCTVLNDFYGGGCQGTVAGNTTSTLTNCLIVGNAFGGGYKAPATTVEIYSNTQPTYPIYTRETGIFTFYDKGSHETWTWVEGGTAGTKHDNTKTLETGISFANLGAVTGNTKITVNGGNVGKNIFGGGNESPSRMCTTVEVKNKCEVGGTVFGGGNSAPIDVSTKVTVDDSHVRGDVFGGGLGLPAVVSGNTTVWIKGIDCFIEKSVLGGGFGADVNGNTRVQIGGESLKTEYETTDCNNN